MLHPGCFRAGRQVTLVVAVTFALFITNSTHRVHSFSVASQFSGHSMGFSTSPRPFFVATPTIEDTQDLRVLLLVEPSPFTYVCGYSNRFQELFRYLQRRRIANSTNTSLGRIKAEVVTVEVVEDPNKTPRTAFGFPIFYSRGFRCWFYKKMSLSFDWTWQVLRRIRQFHPSLLHITSP